MPPLSPDHLQVDTPKGETIRMKFGGDLVCEYKCLAREAIEQLDTVCKLIDFHFADTRDWSRELAERYRDRFVKLHTKQLREQAGNPPGPAGLTPAEIVAVEVLARSVLAR